MSPAPPEETGPVAELRALYAELDAELAPLQAHCRACGGCCDFGTHGEILYASALERRVLALAGPPPAAPAGDSEALVCPYRDAAGRCLARPFRPLGCRTYYCREPQRSAGMAFYERYRARLADISGRAGMEWDYRAVVGDGPGGRGALSCGVSPGWRAPRPAGP